MPLTKAQKEDLVSQLVEKMKEAKSVVFADFKGLSVLEMGELRSNMRDKGVQFKVAKRTLLRLAAKEAGFGDIPSDSLEGSVGAAFSMEDEIAAAKTIFQFAKKNKNLQLRGAIFEGKLLSVAEAKELAQMPGREELLGKFVYLVRYPVQGFHGVLNNTIAGFVRALNAVREKQEQTA